MKPYPVLRVDLGCGSRSRGELGVTKLRSSSPVDVTFGDDHWLAALGWGPPYPTNPQIVDADVEEFVADGSVPRGSRVLMCHVLEHLRRPVEVLTRLSSGDIADLTLVVPNSRLSDADEGDRGHLYSWTQWSLANLLRDARFTPEAVRPVCGYGSGEDLIYHGTPIPGELPQWEQT